MIRARAPSLAAAVIGSAVIPTLIANARYLPLHLLAPSESEAEAAGQAALASNQAE